MGRVRKYSDEAANEILERLANGETLNEICRDAHLPVQSAVRKWTISRPPFGELYVRAREIGYMKMADDLIEIADVPKIGVKTTTKGDGSVETVEGDMIAHRTLQIETRKWLLAKALPKVFGDRIQVDQKIGFTEEFERFVRELKGGPQPKVIEATPLPQGNAGETE